jgi:hypothetical protein
MLIYFSNHLTFEKKYTPYFMKQSSIIYHDIDCKKSYYKENKRDDISYVIV